MAADRNTMTPAQDAASTAQQLDMANIFGEEFTKDPALSKFTDPKSFAKSYKELQSQVGKPRFDVPTPESAPEVVNEFYKKLGVPETVEGYGLKAPDNIPEHMGEYMTETLEEYGKLAHDLKMTPRQAAGVQQWFDAMAMKLGEASQQTEATAAEEVNGRLNEMFTKNLGEQTGQAAVQIKNLLTKIFPDEAVRADLDKAMSNEALLALAVMDKHYKETYGLSDQNIDDPSENSGKSLEDLRKESTALMASDAYRQPMHKDHEATKQKANQMYKDIGVLTDAAKKK